MDISETLGISERDFGIYRLLNAYGAMPASTIAARLKMNRTTVFSALRRLVERGLVCEIPKKGVTWFAATDAEQIHRQGKEQLQKETDRVQSLHKVVELLNTEKGTGTNRPSVTFYEGEDGIVSLFAQSLTLSKEQCAFLTLEQMPAKILAYLQQEYIEEKLNQDVHSRVLIPDSPRARKYRKLDKDGNRETRLVPSSAEFQTEYIIAEDHVALVDFHPPCIGVLIESPHIAKTMRSVFELVWKGGKRKIVAHLDALLI